MENIVVANIIIKIVGRVYFIDRCIELNLWHLTLHHTKVYRRNFNQHKHIFRQYLIVTVVMSIAFLPVRLLFWTYISHNWLGNLGMMSIIGLTMFALVKKNKLGNFGIYFTNRIRRFIYHRLFFMVLLTPLYTVVFLLFALWAIDRGEFLYEHEREYILGIIVYETIHSNNTNSKIFPDDLVVNYDLPIPKSTLTKTNMPFKANTIIGMLKEYDLYPKPETMSDLEKSLRTCNIVKSKSCVSSKIDELIGKRNQFEIADMMISITAYVLNQMSGAWASHFLIVSLIGDFEFVGLLILYRKIYFEKIGFAWVHDLDMFHKNIKWQLRSQMLWEKARKAKGLDKVQGYINWYLRII